MVRVSDNYLPVKQAEQVRGMLRVVVYLEDLGVVEAKSSNSNLSNPVQTSGSEG